MTGKFELEICVGTVADAVAAAAGAADRIELNMGLEVGGLTPTVGLYRQVREVFAGEILVMIRPRSGGFLYTQAERQIMLNDARDLLDAGCDGIVFGALTDSARLDRAFVDDMRQVSRGRRCVFHRAMDLVDDWQACLAELADAGVDRVLTSGMQPTALSGQKRLAEFVQFTEGQSLEIVAGSGVSVDNLAQLVAATGCQQFHGSFSQLLEPIMGPVDLGTPRQTSEDKVRRARAVLDAISASGDSGS